jgi:hypothetical protein
MEKQFETFSQTMQNMAESITVSKDVGMEFPFVRVPKYELLGVHTRNSFNLENVIWAPFVEESELKKWSSFSTSEQGWYNESLNIFHSDPSNTMNRTLDKGKFRDYIWDGIDISSATVVASPGPFAPLWQMSPPPSSLSSINYNLLNGTGIADLVSALKRTGDFVTGNVRLSSENQSQSLLDSQSLTSYGISEIPRTIHLTPVFERLKDRNSSLVGFLLSTIVWDQFLLSCVNDNVKGVVAVVQNSCGQAFTVLLNDGKVC